MLQNVCQCAPLLAWSSQREAKSLSSRVLFRDSTPVLTSRLNQET